MNGLSTPFCGWISRIHGGQISNERVASQRTAEWLEAEVAAGHFLSINEALTIAVAELKASQEDDLAPAKPYVDEARAEVGRGETQVMNFCSAFSMAGERSRGPLLGR